MRLKQQHQSVTYAIVVVLVRSCRSPACPQSGFKWLIDHWGACSVPCGGGLSTRGTACWNYIKKTQAEPELCGELVEEIVKPCGTSPCSGHRWKVCLVNTSTLLIICCNRLANCLLLCIHTLCPSRDLLRDNQEVILTRLLPS